MVGIVLFGVGGTLSGKDDAVEIVILCGGSGTVPLMKGWHCACVEQGTLCGYIG